MASLLRFIGSLLAPAVLLAPVVRAQSNATAAAPLHGGHGTASGPRPFYAIAHRVLSAQGVRDALGDGANAIEVDLMAWREGWWADHDGLLWTNRGDTAEAVFRAIAEERRNGSNVVWVWLDIKNPDYCAETSPKRRVCSVAQLRDLARETLRPHQIRVLYGFLKPSRAYRMTRDDLQAGEAISLNGDAQAVAREFADGGPADRRRRVYSYGYFRLAFDFGDCTEHGYYTCTELRQGVESAAFGQVYGWTLARNQASYADKLMSLGVDGLIYGFKESTYYSHAKTRAAARQMFDWLDTHRDKRRLAGRDDFPW